MIIHFRSLGSPEFGVSSCLDIMILQTREVTDRFLIICFKSLGIHFGVSYCQNDLFANDGLTDQCRIAYFFVFDHSGILSRDSFGCLRLLQCNVFANAG